MAGPDPSAGPASGANLWTQAPIPSAPPPGADGTFESAR
jgi:hypothetical protein